MIEINLLPGKKKKAAGGAGFKLALPDFQGLLASIKNPWLLVASAASVIVVGGGLLLFITQSTRLRVLERRLVDVQAEKRRFDVVIAQKRQSEKMRDSLMSEINIIRGIDADRYVWPHILDQITKALPPYTWLNSVGTQPTAARPWWPGSRAARWTFRHTPPSCGSSPRRPGSPTSRQPRRPRSSRRTGP